MARRQVTATDHLRYRTDVDTKKFGRFPLCHPFRDGHERRLTLHHEEACPPEARPRPRVCPPAGLAD